MQRKAKRIWRGGQDNFSKFRILIHQSQLSDAEFYFVC